LAHRILPIRTVMGEMRDGLGIIGVSTEKSKYTQI